MNVILLQYDEKSSMMIHRSGNATESALENLHNNHIYRGDENDLILQRIFTEKFICEFQLQYYPFDTQICNMILIMQVGLNIFVSDCM